MTSSYKNAGLLRRLGAMFYDGLLLAALLMVASLPPVMISGGADSALIAGPFYKLYLYILSFLFFGWFWTHGGQTLGMRSWKLQLTREDHRPIGWDNALYRYLIATVSLFLFGLGFIWILFDKQGLAWHDLVSRTKIIVGPDQDKKPHS